LDVKERESDSIFIESSDQIACARPGFTLAECALADSPLNRGGSDMALTQSRFQDDFDRMVVRFTMKNDQATVACAVSTDAMDQLEGSSRTPPAQREQQFLRLRDRIEARAARKFNDAELEGNPPGVILRGIDFR
jgi:hypothetical protein